MYGLLSLSLESGILLFGQAYREGYGIGVSDAMQLSSSLFALYSASSSCCSSSSTSSLSFVQVRDACLYFHKGQSGGEGRDGGAMLTVISMSSSFSKPRAYELLARVAAVIEAKGLSTHNSPRHSTIALLKDELNALYTCFVHELAAQAGVETLLAQNMCACLLRDEEVGKSREQLKRALALAITEITTTTTTTHSSSSSSSTGKSCFESLWTALAFSALNSKRRTQVANYEEPKEQQELAPFLLSSPLTLGGKWHLFPLATRTSDLLTSDTTPLLLQQNACTEIDGHAGISSQIIHDVLILCDGSFPLEASESPCVSDFALFFTFCASPSSDPLSNSILETSVVIA